MQDVDTAFLNKSNLEANVDALAQEVEFLKALYLEVRLVFSRHSRMRVLSLHALEAESGLWVSSAGFLHLVPLLLRPACSLSPCLGDAEGQGLHKASPQPCWADTDLLSPVIQISIGQPKG